MRIPTVAIVGRPNTGKSTLFNRLAGMRKAIESAIPGTTRDHIAHRIETLSLDFLLLDTGGMGGGTDDKAFEADVHRQSLLALENADLILFTINAREALTKSDFAIAELLRKKRKAHVPVIVVVTKCDAQKFADEMQPECFHLGVSKEIITVSATHNIGTENLLKAIIKMLKQLHFGKVDEASSQSNAVRIAIIGKPNVGKSSIINAFMSDPQRRTSPLLVSPIPGTTRDAVDTTIRFHERDYIFVDTAGIKRRGQTDRDIETFAYLRSIRALEESDVAVLVLPAVETVSHVDKRIAGLAVESGKGLIILVNKIDLLKGEERIEKIAEIRTQLPFCRFAPVIPCSALSRDGLLKIFDIIETVQANRTRRIPIKDLRAWYSDAIYGRPMGALRAKYITQAEDPPPTFVLFVKDPKAVRSSQLRFLENSLRSLFAFEGTPIRWITKSANSTGGLRRHGG
ncbi:MAG: ribosome biogenesis GTPase Der [Candidatus Peribacteraceae bacterium]|nr:ribosome biogenesis GTPase Der [Candidatus Peribacteraceae bacterium]